MSGIGLYMDVGRLRHWSEPSLMTQCLPIFIFSNSWSVHLKLPKLPRLGRNLALLVSRSKCRTGKLSETGVCNTSTSSPTPPSPASDSPAVSIRYLR